MIKELLPADGSDRTRKAADARARFLRSFFFFFPRGCEPGDNPGAEHFSPGRGKSPSSARGGGARRWGLCDGGRFRAKDLPLLVLVCSGAAIHPAPLPRRHEATSQVELLAERLPRLKALVLQLKYLRKKKKKIYFSFSDWPIGCDYFPILVRPPFQIKQAHRLVVTDVRNQTQVPPPCSEVNDLFSSGKAAWPDEVPAVWKSVFKVTRPCGRVSGLRLTTAESKPVSV